MNRLIGIASTRKEVGKTTIALNLATGLAMSGKNISLVDLDFENSGLNNFLGVENLPITLNDVLKDNLHIKEAEYLHASGLKVIASAKLRKYSHDLLKQKITDLRHSNDFVLVDSNSGKGLISLLDTVSQILVVTSIDEETWNEAGKTIALAEDNNVTVLGLILNQVPRDVDIEQIETRMQRPVLGVVPHCKYHSSAFEKKHPAVYLYPKTRKYYKEIIGKLKNKGVL